MCKKMIYLVSFVLVLVAVPLVTHAQVVNLMHTDPSFEDEIIIVSPGWASWTTYGGGGSVEIDTTDSIDGAKSLRINQTSGQFNVIAAAIPLTPGEMYTCSFWARADAPRPISLRFQSMNNSGFVTGNFDLTTEWAEYTLTEEAPNPNNDIKLQFITNDALGISYWLDFVYVYAGEYVAGIEPLGQSRAKAADPDPADGAEDVPRDAVLNWTPGEYANTHDVYFGTSFDDVNNATVTVDLTGVYRGRLSDSSYAVPERLDLDETCYWRIDEVNDLDPNSPWKGHVWSFTAEPVAIPIPAGNITATASSYNSEVENPNNTINGSGLDGNLHSTVLTDMWLTAIGEPTPAWILYDFDKAYKLHEMLVWNYNGPSFLTTAGLKDVVVEYSPDGTNWVQIDGVNEFARASGLDDYAPNTTVAFDGIVAKSVKISVNSNWSGGLADQFGLSEVQFMQIPVNAREPSPDSGATDIGVDVPLSWRAGREAVRHEVYLNTDGQAVIDGNVPIMTVTEASYTHSLDLASTYYWRVDEVNDAELPTTWRGDVWDFATQEYLTVDDFESYNDLNPDDPESNRIFLTWIGGDIDLTNGSQVGHDTYPFAELTNVHDGDQSMPLFYDNTVAAYSEATVNVADLSVGQDWAKHGIKALTLRFFGDPNNNVQQMYVKLNGSSITYDGEAENLKRAGWQMWYISLADFDVNLGNVTELSVGFERFGTVGGQGIVLLDSVRLYSHERQLITPVEPGTAGLQAHYQFEGTTNDSSINARHGTITGNPTFVAGKVGQAISFDGLSDYVNLDGYKGITATNDLQPAFSIACWLKTSGDGAMVSWGSGAGAPVGGQYLTFRVDGGRLRSEHGNGNLRGNTYVNDGEWHHCALTVVEGGNLRVPQTMFYVDGMPDTVFSGSNNIYNLTADADVSIGRQAYNDGVYIIGSIDDVRIYNRVLIQEEVTWLAGRIEPFDKPF